MAIDAATMKKIASLSRIRVAEDRLDPLAREISGILTWIEQLDAVNTTGVEPMTSAVEVKLPLREDVVSDGGDSAKVLANAPKSNRGYFVVPKVIE